jgi:putative transposase
MPRPPRIYVPRLSVHVFQRGHNRSPIFHERDDYERFLTLVSSAAIHNGLDVHVFSLMTNHYHLVATPTSASALPRAMKQIDGDYVRYYNRKHRRSGTLWGGRYQAKIIHDERYWWTCLRYVERNPVEAGIVAVPEEYEWSSYRVYAMGAEIDWLVPHPLYEHLGSTPGERQTAYRNICKVSDTLQMVTVAGTAPAQSSASRRSSSGRTRSARDR